MNIINQKWVGKAVFGALRGFWVAAVIALALPAGMAYAQVAPGTCTTDPTAGTGSSLAVGCGADADTEESVAVGIDAEVREYRETAPIISTRTYTIQRHSGGEIAGAPLGNRNLRTAITVLAGRVNENPEDDVVFHLQDPDDPTERERVDRMVRRAVALIKLYGDLGPTSCSNDQAECDRLRPQLIDASSRMTGFRSGEGNGIDYTYVEIGGSNPRPTPLDGRREVAIGSSASVTGEESVAIGRGARVGATPTGANVQPRANAAERSVAIGAGATVSAGSHDSVAIGRGSEVTGVGGVAIGGGAVRLDAQGNPMLDAQGNPIIEDGAQAAAGAVAIGQRANAAANSIAIGRGVTAMANQIRIGGAQTADVHIGMYELRTMDTRITTNTAGIRTNAGRISDNADDIETNRAGVAMALSLSALPHFRQGNSWGIAAATFESETAIAFGANFDIGQDRVVRVGISSAGGETSGAVGFGMKF